ncbi:hypothetical protein JDV02_001144 [Purpureocillium takamizusanense]|uniref:Cell wall proline rich protein n=1 Tax=Purpureocillium takamizusanense TaxID=2060973 RepID=A0A9Q8V666_9HYPO|nr:uncharacterized protein JDV02_001144 [Purpureocillium takamizusanense]UNI14525.1 hypothetical protein JDV02_001144 [Purpureocillium takamizusanense]
MASAQGPALAVADASPRVHGVEDGSRRSTDLDASSDGPFTDAIPHDDAPPPNPPFIFPARMPSPSQVPTINAREYGRRPMSAIEPQNVPADSPSKFDERQRRSVALPAFSFNPGASLPPNPESFTLLSPPVTPSSSKPLASPSRPLGHGHRRGGSEFVGGSIRDGNSIAVMSTSPTRSESGFASPGLAPPPRRGHRRGVSGAISTNDLPILAPLPDFAMPRSGSAPNSPTAFNLREGVTIPFHEQPPKLPEPADALEDMRPVTVDQGPVLPLTPVTPASDVESCGHRRSVRNRVGFSDKLEYIPRPLSLVSNETSSTATARPGHSVSGSISSIVSAASPIERDSPAPLSRSPTRDLADSRPSTAGAILEHTADLHVGTKQNSSPRRRNSTPTLLNIAEAQIQTEGPPHPGNMVKTPKRWSFFGLESPFAHTVGPPKRRPSSSSSSESVSRAVSGASSSDHEESDCTETGRNTAVVCQPTKKKSKKKRVKGWAGSILPLKPKAHKKRNKMSDVRPPTPPASVGPFEDEDDEAENVHALGPELPTPQVTITNSPEIAEPASVDKRPLSKDDASHPMIDLDAALGPFNTPLPHNSEWEAAQRAAGNTGKRRLHSAQGMKGFSGPGMHYHRRAESAPDLPPFDPGRSGINRFGSNSTMADVFEEDEEDDDEPDAADRRRSAFGRLAAADSTDSDTDDGDATPPATVVPSTQRGSIVPDIHSSSDEAHGTRQVDVDGNEFENVAAHSVRTECSKTSLQDDVIAEEPPSIIYRSLNPMQGGADSAVSSPRRLSGTKDLAPVEVGTSLQGGAANMPISPYSTSHASSSHPSPRSPMSMDAQRISTAPSSVTDENSFQSLLMGEPGPEVRISMDYDIPSLTSSNSTMTRDSAFSPNPRLSQPSFREQRPVSVSSAAFGRRRSSLVSLSRLISSSHGERSKLSMEVTLDNEAESKPSRSKSSKTKQRLGRMMQFWKPNKDGAPS